MILKVVITYPNGQENQVNHQDLVIQKLMMVHLKNQRHQQDQVNLQHQGELQDQRNLQIKKRNYLKLTRLQVSL